MEYIHTYIYILFGLFSQIPYEQPVRLSGSRVSQVGREFQQRAAV